MKKNKKIKIKGIKTVVKLEKKTDRPSFPRPAVHEKKTDYKRSREAAKIRKEILSIPLEKCNLFGVSLHPIPEKEASLSGTECSVFMSNN